MRVLVAVLALARVLTAAYSNLISTGDGSAVYFQVQTGFVAQSWYSARMTGAGVAVEALSGVVADVSASGAVVARASYGERYCGFAGSTCFLAPSCSAVWSIRGPGIDVGNSRRRTFLRLDRAGALAWIDQDATTNCTGLSPQPPTRLNGLYDSATLRPVAPANGARLANERSGRRVITGEGRALVFVGNQLSWLDANGAAAIRHAAGAVEAVTDAAGANIVYAEPSGRLHWIAAADQDLGFSGSSPALSEDGRRLVFLGADDSLQVYDRASGAVTRLGSDAYSTFTLGGAAVFAVTRGGRLVRIEAAAGAAVTWLEPTPEIDSADAPGLPVSVLCPLICYGTPDPGLILGRGMLLVLRGRYLDQPGWRARIGGADFPLHALSDQAAWVQIPSLLAESSGIDAIEVYHPDHPLKFREAAQVQDRVVTCFGALHQDFGAIVTAENPAAVGEIVHIFLTGLRGVEAVSDETPNPVDHLVQVANPPAIANPGAIEPLFFGLAPGLIAMQQLDARVLGQLGGLLFSDVNAFGCAIPISEASGLRRPDGSSRRSGRDSR